MPVVPAPGVPAGRVAPLFRRPVVIAAAAFVVVVLAALPLLFQDPEDPVVASTVPVATTVVTPTTTPEPTPSTTPEAVVPDPVTGGTVTWTEFTGDFPGLASSFIFPEGPNGFTGAGLLVRNAAGFFSIWNSTNGADWVNTQTQIPTTSTGYTMETTPSGYWMIGYTGTYIGWNETPLWGPASLFYSRSAQPGTWEEVAVDGFRRPASPGLKWEETILRPARVGDAIVVPVEYRLDFDWETILGIAPGTYGYFEVGFEDEFTDVLSVWGGFDRNPGDPLAHVLIRETSEGLTLTDDDTGDQLLFIPRGTEGLDGEMLAELGGWRTYSLFTLGPDGVVEADLWNDVAGNPGNPWALQVYEFEGSAVVWVGREDGDNGYITSDGLSFRSHPSPPFEFATITNDTESGYLHASSGSFFPPIHWISTDSVNWSELDVESSLRTSLHRLDDAWLVIVYNEDGDLSDTHYMSFDDETWQPVTNGPTGLGPVFSVLAWDDTIVLVFQDYELEVDATWIGSVELTR